MQKAAQKKQAMTVMLALTGVYGATLTAMSGESAKSDQTGWAAGYGLMGWLLLLPCVIWSLWKNQDPSGIRHKDGEKDAWLTLTELSAKLDAKRFVAVGDRAEDVYLGNLDGELGDETIFSRIFTFGGRMKVFKFVGGNPFPDVYYFSETMAFGHSSDYEIIYRAHLIDLGLHSIGGPIYNYLLTEALGLLDRIGLTEFLEEVLGLSDLEERWGWGYFDEILNLQDTTSQRMVYSITLNEGLGFVESGSYNLALVDYRVTWRARTRIPGIGYEGRIRNRV